MLSFDDLVRLRNGALKHGSTVPWYVFDVAFEHDLVEDARFEVTVDAGQVRESRLIIGMEDTAKPIRRQPGEDPEAFIARAEAEVIEMSRRVLLEVTRQEVPPFARTRYIVRVIIYLRYPLRPRRLVA